jgi:small-conductance mechanosensitive channel
MRQLHHRRHAVTLAFLAALVSWPGSGPPSSAAQDETSPPEAEPRTLTVVEIAREADRSSVRLNEIRSGLQPVAAVTAAEERIASLETEFEATKRELEASPVDRMSERALRDLRASWIRRQKELESLRDTIGGRAESLSAIDEEAGDLEKRWREIASRPEEDLPAPLRDRAQEIVKQASTVEREVDALLAEVLTAQERLTAMGAEASSALQRLEVAQRDARERLLRPEHPPLWRAFESSAPGDSLIEQARKSFEADRAALVSFLRDRPQHFVIQLALFAVFVLLTVTLHRRSKTIGDAEPDASLRTAALVLSRPLSAALLLTLVLTRWISPEAPTIVFEINRVVAVLPLLRFLPGLVHRSMRRPLVAMMALYVIDQSRYLTVEGSLLRRLLLLLVSGAAVAGLTWLLRPGGGLKRVSASRWWQLSVLGARVAAALLVGSIVANVLGAVRLADRLTEITLNTAYLSIAMFTLTLLLDGIVTLALRTRPALVLNVVRRHGDLLKAGAARVTLGLAVILWVYFFLTLSGFLVPFTETAGAVLGKEWGYGAFRVSLGAIVVLAIAIWAALKIARLIRFVLDEDVLSRFDLPRGVPQAVSMLAYYGILAVGFLIALTGAGIQLTQLTLLISALGVGIGFGLQNIVNNFVSGLILIFERPIKIGDVVEIGTLVGEVRTIGIRASVVRTFSGSEVIVPNGDLVSNTVVNWTLSDRRRRIELPIGVAYGTDPNRVIEILLKTTADLDEVLQEPEPQALFRGFGDSSLDFELRFWTGSEHWPKLSSVVNVRINDALEAAGIEIPFPQRTVHMRSDDASAPGPGPAAEDESEDRGSDRN